MSCPGLWRRHMALLGSAPMVVMLACGDFQSGQDPLSSEESPQVDAAISSGPAGKVSAQYNDSPLGEGINNVMDGKSSTKYLTFHRSCWLRWKANSPTVVTSFAITSANDFPGRDPKNFSLQGSNDNKTWTILSSQTRQAFSARFQKKSYAIANTTAYVYYRLNIRANSGDVATQLAEWDLISASPAEVVTLYEHCPYGGFAIKLPVGNFSAAELAARGIPTNQVSAIKIDSGFQATLYDGDDFTGRAVTFTANDDCLVDNGFNDLLSSISVSRLVDPTAPRAPGNLAAVATSSSQVSLSWSDLSDNETLFRIELSTDGSSFSSKATTAANATSAAVAGLSASTTYYFRVRAENGAGASAYSSVVSATTQNGGTGEWSGFVYPNVDFTDEAAGLEGSAIFHAAIPDVTQMMREQCLAVCQELYSDNNDRRVNFTTLHLLLRNDPQGVAAKWGDSPEIWIGVSAQYIASFYHQNGNNYDLVLKEVRGILSHEGTHGYQAQPKNCGQYDGSSTFWGFIEGEADAVRAELTNWTPTRYPTKGGSWNGGYTQGGFFLSWCKHNKKPTFLIELNHAARDLPTFTWDAAFRQILDQSVQSVWDEYQATLP